MTYHAHLTRISQNAKTGPIPVSTTDSSTCPKNCPQFDTCYAKSGPLLMHWRSVDSHARGVDWSDFCEEVQRLPRNQLWRHNQAGDLPGDGRKIDSDALYQLVQANKGKRGFTYTHYPLEGTHNLSLMEAATAAGFTVNVSCDSLAMSDRVRDITDLPQAVMLPSTTTEKSLYTVGGRKVTVCPATYRDDVMCWNCGICHDASKTRAIIGFPAHGTRKKVIDIRLAT